MRISAGLPYPLGATMTSGGVNFSIYSRSAVSVELLLFDRVGDSKPGETIPLNAGCHRTFHYWHARVEGVGPGQLYGYRVEGPSDPEPWHRFDPRWLLLDPYGKVVARPPGYVRYPETVPAWDFGRSMKSVVADPGSYDWEGDTPPRIPYSDTVIYELHVGGFTRNPSSGVPASERGTYLGLTRKIPYLLELGITAVELMPVFYFDDQEAPPGLSNYWGYNPVSFFAPHEGYAVGQDPLGVIDEFREMVKCLHRAGIEVILDVVYNHTAEGDETGPTFCFKGLGNHTYYLIGTDYGYLNFSGTGNTLNANHSVVRRLIMDSLRYWVQEMHVDGFRFDLASILARDEQGKPMNSPPILWEIESDPVLAGTKLIAEAWDAAGLYQVGGFIGDRWQEWNGQFRDDVRSFFIGAEGLARRFSGRLTGSPDLYLHRNQHPERSINFVTCHDGFTLADLVSYNSKHNEANLEGNRDGSTENLSWNCGVEGPSTDPAVLALRGRQVRNLMLANLVSWGVPMILMGDEIGRSQAGNNNAYCQDNPLSWMDWANLPRESGFLRFVRELIRLRRLLFGWRREKKASLGQLLKECEIAWHGVESGQPDWSFHSHSIALSQVVPGTDLVFFVAFNAYWEDLAFAVPESIAGGSVKWWRLVDTSLPSPLDISPWDSAPEVGELKYRVQSRSSVLLGGVRTARSGLTAGKPGAGRVSSKAKSLKRK